MNKPLTPEERKAIDAWLEEWKAIGPSSPVSYVGYVKRALEDAVFWREQFKSAPHGDANNVCWYRRGPFPPRPSEHIRNCTKENCPWMLAQAEQ